MLALTHTPSPRIDHAQRTHVARVAIDYDRALQQHADYCRLLRRCGVDVRTLDVNRDLPDSVFIEDTAVVLDEVAVVASMGVASRQAEPAGVEPELRKYRDEIFHIRPPATLEGGDVLQVGRTLLVGLSARTNAAGVKALDEITRRFGYRLIAVPVRQCLHLKTACTALPDQTLLINPAWFYHKALDGFDCLCVPPEEPWAANILLVGQRVCAAAEYGGAVELLGRRGFQVETVDHSELAKAEGGMTCLSLLFNTAE